MLNLTAKLNIASAFEVARLVARSAAADNARIENLGKMSSLIIQQAANAANQGAQKNTANVSKTEKSVEHNANVLTAVIRSE